MNSATVWLHFAEAADCTPLPCQVQDELSHSTSRTAGGEPTGVTIVVVRSHVFRRSSSIIMVRARLVSGAQDQKLAVMATSLKNGASLGHTCNMDPLSIKTVASTRVDALYFWRLRQHSGPVVVPAR
jgi:hypothetical protein